MRTFWSKFPTAAGHALLDPCEGFVVAASVADEERVQAIPPGGIAISRGNDFCFG
jgi:hypothetical protein